ncbi:TPA_asm: hypothetical protein vir519_00030 [Caudoviricetes sp. vir519]|nr:TPA_asm: hypothetical protein vir519_00030 [Caudoviricetes sp. vir519]
MPEVRLRLEAEDELSDNLKEMESNLNKVDQAVKQTKESTSELADETSELEKNTQQATNALRQHELEQVEMRIAVVKNLDKVSDLAYKFERTARTLERFGIITREQSDQVERLGFAFETVISGIQNLILVQGLLEGTFSKAAKAAGEVNEGLGKVEKAATATSSSLGVVAAKIGLVITAGVGLGVIFSTIVLGFTRMIKYGESFGDAFTKSFNFSIDSLKRFGKAIQDAIFPIQEAEKAEGKLYLTITEAAKALENQKDIVKPKTMAMEAFVLTLKAAGASEEQLKQAMEEGMVTFKSQTEIIREQKRAQEELSKTVAEYTGVHGEALIQQLLETGQAAQAEAESLDEFAARLKEIGVSDEYVAKALENHELRLTTQKDKVEALGDTYINYINGLRESAGLTAMTAEELKNLTVEAEQSSDALNKVTKSLIDASEAERYTGVSAEKAAEMILQQKKVVRGKNEDLEAYKEKLKKIGLTEQEIANIIDNNIWPWEKQEKQVTKTKNAVAEYLGFKIPPDLTQPNLPSAEGFQTEYYERVTDYLEQVLHKKQAQASFTQSENKELQQQIQYLQQIVDLYSQIENAKRRTTNRTKSYLQEQQSQAKEMDWLVNG